MVTVNWMLDEIDDPEVMLALGVLEFILVGNSAAPLRKALIDSGLGEGLTGSGLADDFRQPYFTVGLKGIDEADAGKVEALILATLAASWRRTASTPRPIEAAINTFEFADAREQYRLVPARHGADVPLHAHLAAWRRSVRAAELRGAAGGAQGTASRRAPGCSRR